MVTPTEWMHERCVANVNKCGCGGLSYVEYLANLLAGTKVAVKSFKTAWRQAEVRIAIMKHCILAIIKASSPKRFSAAKVVK